MISLGWKFAKPKMETNKNAKNSLTTEIGIQIRRCHRRHSIIIVNMYENNKDEIPHFLIFFLFPFRFTWINVWIETAEPNGGTYTYQVFPLFFQNKPTKEKKKCSGFIYSCSFVCILGGNFRYRHKMRTFICFSLYFIITRDSVCNSKFSHTHISNEFNGQR